MKKTIIVTLSLIAALGFCTAASWAYTFPNGTLVDQYYGDHPLVNGTWVDVIGDPNVFEIYGSNLTNIGGQYHLTVFTNWNPSYNGYGDDRVRTADFFFDTNRDGIWDAAIVLDSTRSDFGTIYYNPVITTSYDIFTDVNEPYGVYGGLYDPTDPKFIPVLGTSALTGTAAVLWGDGYVDIILSDIAGFDSNRFAYLMASATCGNDTAEGKVPLPSTLVLLIFGLLGLAGLGRRRAGKQY